MTAPVDVAVPRKGRPLEAVLERLAERAGEVAGHRAGERASDEQASNEPGSGDGPASDGGLTEIADDVISTLRFEKAVAKDDQTAEGSVYDRLAGYSGLQSPYRPEFTLLRDDRAGRPRRIVFDSLTVSIGDLDVRLVGREEPFRAVRTHEVPLAFDSADLVLEEVVELRPEPLARLADLNARIDPRETDVRVAAGLGDTVHHTLLGTPEVLEAGRDLASVDGDARTGGPAVPLNRRFVERYDGPLCVSPRYERLVSAVLGTRVTGGIDFVHPQDGREEEAAIAETGLGVYLTVTGSTARDHGLVLGQQLFPSETVLMENVAETGEDCAAVKELVAGEGVETALSVS